MTIANRCGGDATTLARQHDEIALIDGRPQPGDNVPGSLAEYLRRRALPLPGPVTVVARTVIET
jgi:hypothetical protein